jgi:hypothetical protein
MATESKSEKTDADEILQSLKKSHARLIRLPANCASRADVMKVLAHNRAITTLNLSDCPVRLCIAS